MPAGRDLGPLEDLALAAVEGGHVAAREWDPHDVLGVDIHSARTVARRRYLVHFRERGLGRIGLGRIEPNHVAGEAERGAPNRAIDRARSNAVERHVDAAVLVGIEWLVRLGVFVTLAVAIGVEDKRS